METDSGLTEEDTEEDTASPTTSWDLILLGEDILGIPTISLAQLLAVKSLGTTGDIRNDIHDAWSRSPTRNPVKSLLQLDGGGADENSI